MNLSKQLMNPQLNFKQMRRTSLLGVLLFSLGCAGALDVTESEDDKKSDKGKGKSDKKKGEEDGDDGKGGEKEKDKKEGEKDGKDGGEEEKPTEKEIEFKLEDEFEDLKQIRIVLHPELGQVGEKSQLEKPIADVPAKFKDGLIKIKAKPIAEKVDLGEEGYAMIWVSVYFDKDESEDFSEGDYILGSVVEAPAYARKENKEGMSEWTHLELGTGKFIEIRRPLLISRLDNLSVEEAPVFGAKTKRVEKEISHLALASFEELKDFSKNFDESDRGAVVKVNRDEEFQKYEPTKEPPKERQGSKLPSYFPQFGNVSINAIAGFKSESDTLSKDSELVAMGCLKSGGEDEDEALYDAVIAMWIEPTAEWIKDPATAYSALVYEYRPGWNAVAVQVGMDGSGYAVTMMEEELKRLSFEKGCKLEVPEL